MHTIQINDGIIHQVDSLFDISADLCGRAKMLEGLENFRDKFELITIGRSILSRPIEAIKIGKGERKICIFAAHSAPENITANLAYLLAFLLLQPDFCKAFSKVSIPLLLTRCTYYVIPCVNPDGVELYYHGVSENPLRDRQLRMSGGDFCTWCANARGVDLNFNYDYRFDEYKIAEGERGIKPGCALYSGEWAESEPECKSVANFLRLIEPCALVLLRAGSSEVAYAPNNAREGRIADRIARAMGCGTEAKNGGDTVSGLCDYAGHVLGISSFAVSLGEKGSVPFADIKRTLERLARGIILLPTYL